MTHSVYFIGHPTARATLKEHHVGFVVEFRSTPDSNDWEEYSSFQMTLDEIEERLYNGYYDKG